VISIKNGLEPTCIVRTTIDLLEPKHGTTTHSESSKQQKTFISQLFIVYLHHNNHIMQIRKLSSRYQATQEERQAQRKDFENILTGLGFRFEWPSGQVNILWPDGIYLDGAKVWLNDSFEKITLSSARWKSKGDGSMSVNFKVGELLANPKRTKTKLREIVNKCAEQDRLEAQRKKDREERAELSVKLDQWIKERVNDKSSARVDSGEILFEIRNQEGRTAYSVHYNQENYEVRVNKYCLRTLNNYDKFNQTRLDELKKEVEEYQQYLNSANNLITQLRAEYLID